MRGEMVNEKIQHYKENALQFWQKLTRQQKTMLLASIALLLIALTSFVYLASKTEYEVVYTNLAPEDAAGIKAYLDQNAIPYKLNATGTIFSVPQVNAAAVKLDLASNGLPKSGSIGYEIFRDNMSAFGTTEAEFSVLERDAISGEMEKLIRNINGISSAEVMITLPQESLFVSNNQPDLSTASVIVVLDPLAQIDDAKIKTLYQLVSRSVPKLPVENITISDQYGQLLQLPEEGDLSASAATTSIEKQFKIKKSFENDIQNNLQHLLGTLIGKDKVIVSVVANLNFDQKKEVQNIVEPVLKDAQTGIPIAIQEITKSFSGQGSVPGGIVGTGTTDVPSYPGSDGGTSEYEETERSVNNEVNRITREIQASPFAVRDLTLNVGVEPPNPDQPTSLTDETKAAIQQVLFNVVRASLTDSNPPLTDEEISKRISVFPHSFDKRGQIQASADNNKWLYYGLGGLALLAIGGAGYAIVRRRKFEGTEEELIPVSVERQLDMEPETHEMQIRKQLEQLAKRKPDQFAKLLRSWIAEE
jgi:flagellar M-ring protein FliF